MNQSEYFFKSEILDVSWPLMFVIDEFLEDKLMSSIQKLAQFFHFFPLYLGLRKKFQFHLLSKIFCGWHIISDGGELSPVMPLPL